MTPPYRLTIAEAGTEIRAGRLSCEELTLSVLRRIEETEPVIHAYVEILAEQALAEAGSSSAELRSGLDRGPLHGIPLAIKDIIDIAGSATRCGSAVRADAAPATKDAAVVTQLRRAGAVILGKTVTHEFAGGVLSPPARNPWDPSRIPGGRSGGSAASVAAGSCLGSVGTDTAGSIRVPASLTGAVGLKPTMGTVDTAGVFPLSRSLDTVGPIARNVTDAALLLSAMTGAVAMENPIEADPGPGDLSTVRLGVPRSYFFERLQVDVDSAVAAALNTLQALHGSLIETEWQWARAAMAAGFVIVRPEMAMVHSETLQTTPERFGTVLRSRLEAFSLFPASGYLRAQEVRRALREDIVRVMDSEKLDAFVMPTTAATATPAEDLMISLPDGPDPIHAGFTRFTMPFNTVGLPAISVPCGFDTAGLPIGLQFVGRPGADRQLLQIARTYEQACRWHAALPVESGSSRPGPGIDLGQY